MFVSRLLRNSILPFPHHEILVKLREERKSRESETEGKYKKILKKAQNHREKWSRFD